MSVFGTERSILQSALDWVSDGHQVVLVTVVKTWGSSPRPRGSLMVMCDDGRHDGSVSGGCVEEDLFARYRNAQLADRYPTLVDYGIDRQEATRFGLPCGGRLELLIEQLDSPAQLQALLKSIKTGELI
ncbi:MAG: XdhC family protein, partial [Gammaproteobacteria bacterium]